MIVVYRAVRGEDSDAFEHAHGITVPSSQQHDVLAHYITDTTTTQHGFQLGARPLARFVHAEYSRSVRLKLATIRNAGLVQICTRGGGGGGSERVIALDLYLVCRTRTATKCT